MRLLDTYATNTGSTIDKPYIYTKFYPCPKNYITLQAETPYDSRNYAYWQEVIDILLPHLESNGIKIVQVGKQNESKLANVDDFLGKTDIAQLAYIIENSKLHFGADSFCVHLASHFNKPIVSIYSISNPNVAGPHFGNNNNHILIRAYENIGTKKPSYSQQESPKSINTIKPEEIAKSVLELLKIKNENLIETLMIGDKFKNGIIDFVPNKILSPDFAPEKAINMRIDYCDAIDEQIIFHNLKLRKFILFLNAKNCIKSTQILSMLKNNIIQIIFDCTELVPDKKYIKELIESGHSPIILYTGDDKEYFDKIKIDLIELNLKFVCEKNDKNLIDNFEKICHSNTEQVYIKSNRVILSNGNVFLSKQHMLENKPTDSHTCLLKNISNLEKLNSEIDFLYIFRKQSNA